MSGRRLTCSIVLWRGMDTANKYHWHVWGELTVDGPHGVCHSPRACVLPRSTLLSLQGALQRHCPRWALHFEHFPGLSLSDSWVLCKVTDPHGLCVLCPSGPSCSSDWVLGKWTVPGGPCILYTSMVQAAWFPVYAVRAQSQVWRVSPLGSLPQAVTLLADVNHPRSQEDVVSNWQPAQFAGGCDLWGQYCSHSLPSSSGCHIHASLPPGR